jgi:hypothetical protein
MLYSKNGAYPKPLPFRILVNNVTRTDPTSFTPEEIAAAGYVAVVDPPFVPLYHRLDWTGEWVVTETRTLESAKAIKLEELSKYRKSKETQFTFNGTSLYLDQQCQARITGAVAGFAYRPYDIITWEVSRGNFVQFDKVTMEALAVAAWTHIKLCYEEVKVVTDLIKAATTIGQVDLIEW